MCHARCGAKETHNGNDHSLRRELAIFAAYLVCGGETSDVGSLRFKQLPQRVLTMRFLIKGGVVLALGGAGHLRLVQFGHGAR